MSLTTDWLQFGEGGVWQGYGAWPTRAPAALPTVMVIQEAWGVDAHIQDVTRRFAAAGYFAFAPDLFSKNGTRPASITAERLDETIDFLSSLTPAQRGDPALRAAELAKRPADVAARVGESVATLFGGVYLPVVLAAAQYLHEEQPRSRGQKLASIGFCMGGGLSAQLAGNDAELAAAIIFYGRSPPPDLTAKIRCPVRGFYAGPDANVNQTVPAFAEQIAKQGGSFVAVTYPDAHHAFFNDTRSVYDVAAARDAFAKVISFLRETIGQELG